MLILNEQNKELNTDSWNQELHYSVLSFKDFRNPDFYFEQAPQLDVFNCYGFHIDIGPFSVVVPAHWTILCSDREFIQTIQLCDISGLENEAFCLNPIDGYVPTYLRIRLRRPTPPDVPWTCPPIDEKNMVVVPIGKIDRPNDTVVGRGPICAIFSPNRIDINRPISDIL